MNIIKIDTKAHYVNVEDAYKRLFEKLTSYAKHHLKQKDEYIDAVNDAFVLVLEWRVRNPAGNLSHRMIYRKLQRVCKLKNQQVRILSLDDPDLNSRLKNV